MLATAIYAQPGSYAFLLGSGISGDAGILTGWQVALDLVRKAAIADNPEDTESHALAVEDPEAWWREHGHGGFGYSDILATLAPSSAARQGLLAGYFEPSESDLQDGLKQPTEAHLAIAELAKEGWTKVILTTNFDRLMEHALTAANVPYTVIDRPEQAPDAFVALARGLVTVVKMNGDWTDLESRNTIEELEEYPEQMVDLLKRIFSEYGLLICAWSSEWDKALVRVLESAPRRYPVYWDSRSSKKEAAQRLLGRLGGQIVEERDANQLFVSLASRIRALQDLAEPPLETEMAIARLKRALPDPVRRIELQDLIDDKTSGVISLISMHFEGARLQFNIDELLDALLQSTRPLLALLVQGVRYDDGTHTQLWAGAVQRLMDARRTMPQLRAFDDLRHYPALLALRAMSIEAVRLGRDEVMILLLTRLRWDSHVEGQRPIPSAGALHLNRVLPDQLVNQSEKWRGKRYPASHLIKSQLEDFFGEQGVDSALYRSLCDDVEYRTGLVQHLLPPEQAGFGGANMGEFADPNSWRPGAGLTPDPWAEVPQAERRFRENYSTKTGAAWSNLFGGESLDDVLGNYRNLLERYKVYR